MSRVFVATEISLGRRVVVKAVDPDTAVEVSAERFRQEITLSANLQHAHIVPVLTAGGRDGVLFYTMPLIEGESLRETLARTGPLGIAETIGILRDVSLALGYAHRHGVAHRDIKPENVMLTEAGAVVLDFGVAKALSASASSTADAVRTGVGISLGTPTYMSPEQAAADPSTDHRTDLYSLGILAYEMLAGYTPFAGRPLKALFAAHASEVPRPIAQARPETPRRLAALVTQCLAKQPADRPPDAESVVAVLDAVAREHRDGGDGRAFSRRAAFGVLALAALVGSAAWLARPQSDEARVRTAAVLPFANLSGLREDDAFTDGMTEELINALGTIEGLRVKSAFSLRGSNADIEEIGRQLDVQTVVAGSVRRAGASVRISVRLVNVADGYQLWSRTFEREVNSAGDVFGVQDELASAIVSALQLRLNPTTQTSDRRATANLAAYEAFLDGRFYMAKRTSIDLQRAVESFERAIALDSTFAAAWAGLADANALVLTYGFIRPEERFAAAREAALTAIRLDSLLAEPYASLGYLGLNYSWDWPQVDAWFARSTELDPNYATAHHWRSLSFNVHGRHDDALQAIRRARELDPVSLIVNRELGRAFYYQGANDSALFYYRRTLELEPTFQSAHVWIARALLAKGDAVGAVAQLRDRADFQGGHSSAVLAYAYAQLGQREVAESIRAELEARSRREYVWPLYLALVELGLGNRARALALLEQGARERSPQIPYLRVDPLFASLRGDPRFTEVLQIVGLPPR